MTTMLSRSAVGRYDIDTSTCDWVTGSSVRTHSLACHARSSAPTSSDPLGERKKSVGFLIQALMSGISFGMNELPPKPYPLSLYSLLSSSEFSSNESQDKARDSLMFFKIAKSASGSRRRKAPASYSRESGNQRCTFVPPDASSKLLLRVLFVKRS